MGCTGCTANCCNIVADGAEHNISRLVLPEHLLAYRQPFRTCCWDMTDTAVVALPLKKGSFHRLQPKKQLIPAAKTQRQQLAYIHACGVPAAVGEAQRYCLAVGAPAGESVGENAHPDTSVRRGRHKQRR
jgi:hypothetical protein